MTDTPERIWATGRAEQGGSWNAAPMNVKTAPPQTEYVRADRIAALEAEVERLRRAIGNEMNHTAIIAHALEGGYIAPQVEDQFTSALDEMNDAIERECAALQGDKP